MNELPRSPQLDVTPEQEQIETMERPARGLPGATFGSDLVADTLRRLGIPYVALVPGSSFRGLHDSLVNHLGNERPQMLVCLHEEASVAIAHGYAKVTGRAMAAALHTNVGLLHAAMAVFDAWCDRMPMLLLGGNGPMDAPHRRPWIEWIHTSRDQAAIIRNFIKWDDAPGSPAAAVEALMRAKWIAETAPQGPTYVNLDAKLQEDPVEAPLPEVAMARFMPPVRASIGRDLIAEAVSLLVGAQRPAIMVGRVSRSVAGWDHRVSLAEKLGARVLTDLKVGASFPTDHPLHAGAPGLRLSKEAADALREADVILSLDWVDLGGTLQTVFGGPPPNKIIQVSRDHVIHNGWNMDHQALPVADLFLSADPDMVVPELDAALELPRRRGGSDAAVGTRVQEGRSGDIDIGDLAANLRAAIADRPFSLSHLPLSWHGGFWAFRHPLEYLGTEGGAGVGAGPGIAVGAALALKGTGRLAIAVCGDGDFLMGHTALWTAVHYGLPLLLVVANNRSFYNDEQHQERVAVRRQRPIENKWIGQRLADPEVDLAALGRAQGAEAFGPIREIADLAPALERAVAAVDAGGVAVVDVRILTGYAQ